MGNAQSAIEDSHVSGTAGIGRVEVSSKKPNESTKYLPKTQTKRNRNPILLTRSNNNEIFYYRLSFLTRIFCGI